MKIAVSSNSNSLDGLISGKLDRSRWFIIFETQTNKFNFMKNGDDFDATKIAEDLANNNVEAVISESCGPKLHKQLSQKDIKVYNVSDLTTMKAVAKLQEGRLKEATLLGC